MKYDYHMHFEYGDYDVEWVKGFFEAAKKRGLDEIGISEHSHTFPEFQQLYYDDLILDDSFVGSFQQKWLKRKNSSILWRIISLLWTSSGLWVIK